MTRTLVDVESDIRDWIQLSQGVASSYDAAGRTWVLKFFPPLYLDDFLKSTKMVVSTSPGFTWGDGVYVVPLQDAYSGMIYGRVGVMGWISATEMLKNYDAAQPTGLRLYQEWIQYKPGLFTLLTTTVHAQAANRRLRNAFRRRFELDLVIFRPDEYNRAYIAPGRDRWFVVADFNVSNALPSGNVGYSDRVHDCELVAIGTEEFLVDRSGFVRQDLIGSKVTTSPLSRVPGARPSLSKGLMATYQANRARGAGALQFLVPKP